MLTVIVKNLSESIDTLALNRLLTGAQGLVNGFEVFGYLYKNLFLKIA